MTKLKIGFISALVIAGVATPLVVQHQNQAKLREKNNILQRQMAVFQTENESLSNRIVQAARTPPASSERLRELLRLRGEVGLLRRQLREAERIARAKAVGVPAQPAQAATLEPNAPASFQIQLVLDEPGNDSETMTNNANGGSGETLHLQKTPLMDYTAISSARIATNASDGAPQIEVEFSEVGKELFAAVTRENINKRLAIVLDGHLYSAPMIRGEILEGKAQIAGAFTVEEAKALADKIREAINVK